MYLMDAIVETAAAVRRMGSETWPLLRLFPILADQLHGAPRLLFDRAAIATAVELTLGRPKVLVEALAHLRIPYPRLWVEWEEVGRARLRERFLETPDPERPIPARLGFLLECDAATGRQASAVNVRSWRCLLWHFRS